MIVGAILFALNIKLPSCNSKKPVVNNGNDTTGTNSKTSLQAQKWDEGKSLFRSNCAACHNPNSDGTGPVLKDVEARWKAAGSYQGKTGEQWLKVWIRNWNDVVNAGYKYGIDMANSRPAQMNVFSSLSDEQIDDILLYVNDPVSHTGESRP